MIIQMSSEKAWSKPKLWLLTPIAWVFIAGFLVRLYSAMMRTIIGPDGAQYIYQASALFNQHWSGLFDCKLSYLSPLPVMIAAAFAVCKDWIVAGQSINVLFGWATLFPLYRILRRFFDRHVCTLTVLIYALIPVFVDGSSEVMRGAMFWFFLTLGMLSFLRQWDDDAPASRYRYDLLASLLCFLLATWCRIEGVVFLAFACVYLCFTRTDRKLQRCFIFIMPMVAIGLAIIGAALVSGADVQTTLRLKQVFMEITRPASNYRELDSWIKSMYAQHGGLHGEFLRRTRENLSLIPVIAIFNNMLEGVFYPFALIFFAGIFGIRKQYRRNRRIAYFVWQSLAGFAVLYIHIIQTWIVMYRFLAVLVFPGCIFMAAGVEKTIHYLQNRRRWPLAKAIVWVSAALVILGLPKNLKPRESDKAVYRQAAKIMAQQVISDPSARIAGFRRTRALEWIILYSHRNSPIMPCSQSLEGAVSSDYRQFVVNLDLAGIRYVLYEERFWPHELLDLPSTPYRKDFRLLGQWQHPDSKKFMLLERFGSKDKEMLP